MLGTHKLIYIIQITGGGTLTIYWMDILLLFFDNPMPVLLFPTSRFEFLEFWREAVPQFMSAMPFSHIRTIKEVEVYCDSVISCFYSIDITEYLNISTFFWSKFWINWQWFHFPCVLVFSSSIWLNRFLINFTFDFWSYLSTYQTYYQAKLKWIKHRLISVCWNSWI